MTGLLRCDVCHAKVNLKGLNRHKQMHQRTAFKLKGAIILYSIPFYSEFADKAGQTESSADRDELPSPTYTPKFKFNPAKSKHSLSNGS